MIVFYITMLIGAILFIFFQQTTFKKFNRKFLKLPLVIAILLFIIGESGFYIALFTNDRMAMYLGIMSQWGFIGMIVSISMLIAFKSNSNK